MGVEGLGCGRYHFLLVLVRGRLCCVDGRLRQGWKTDGESRGLWIGSGFLVFPHRLCFEGYGLISYCLMMGMTLFILAVCRLGLVVCVVSYRQMLLRRPDGFEVGVVLACDVYGNGCIGGLTSVWQKTESRCFERRVSACTAMDVNPSPAAPRCLPGSPLTLILKPMSIGQPVLSDRGPLAHAE